MYKGFNVVGLTFADATESLAAAGREACRENAGRVQKALQSFACQDALDGTKVQSHWFPQIDADVFISHSHGDRQVAYALAGWLGTTFGLKSFVDSAVWGYAEDLLKEIDNKYCLNPGGETYSYEKRNGSTGHVHMMLATALGQMLDRTECLFFLNTPRSITAEGAISKTYSPWLLAEIQLATTMRRATPRRRSIAELQQNFSAEEARAKAAALNVEYEVDLSPFIAIGANDLNRWRESRTDEHPLDDLYRITDRQMSGRRLVYG